ncbi:M15 family metallopeptidase [Salinibacterium sp. SYSU T00001]|uniref:M15 family metallopeptidase n=1 Tax=Homoserinimonas sedimenticola TaxID=2986805 RepID=UPI00223556F9|nr:M15 family metallopeptidase [Salinibacterium sedimenticola]MCW4385883.1 M15 family metallopeptidase [Salinibacterium sedimenticola]
MTSAQHDRRPSTAFRRRRVLAIAFAIIVVAGLIVAAVWWASGGFEAREPAPSESPAASAQPSASPSTSSTPPAEPADKPKSFFDRDARSIDDPTSIWVVSNKLRPLNPIDYAPQDLVNAAVPGSSTLRAEAAGAMEQMFAAATAEAGLSLAIQNAYRSYGTQVSLHNRLVEQLGVERARAQSARPGYSEHQTGLTADIMAANGVCSIQECFATTPEGMWLAENAWRFGYHLRYPQGKTDVTGYIFEPWHYRYVGTALAAELHETQTLTLEEFFGLPPAPDYPPGV